jgi:hypothetical protein
LPAGTTIAPVGAVAGPLSNEALPQIFAGGELGHDPFGAGSVVGVVVVGAVVVGAVVVGAAEVVVGAEVVGGGAEVVVGAEVVGGALVVAGGGAVVVVVGAGAAVGVTPLLATVKFPRRLEVLPSDHVSTTLMLCDPSASFVVSYGSAVPSAAVPAKSKGGLVSVRTGGSVRDGSSRWKSTLASVGEFLTKT